MKLDADMMEFIKGLAPQYLAGFAEKNGLPLPMVQKVMDKFLKPGQDEAAGAEHQMPDGYAFYHFTKVIEQFSPEDFKGAVMTIMNDPGRVATSISMAEVMYLYYLKVIQPREINKLARKGGPQ